jgi:aryl-alcohol dehydrogenase-like predicted oxidoreductase
MNKNHTEEMGLNENSNFFCTMTTLKIKGQATREGTLRYASRFGLNGFRVMPKTHWSVSRLGLGTFRLASESDHSPAKTTIVTKAIESGFNLIDTSSHFGHGGAERIIGRGLNEMIHGKGRAFKRDVRVQLHLF